MKCLTFLWIFFGKLPRLDFPPCWLWNVWIYIPNLCIWICFFWNFYKFTFFWAPSDLWILIKEKKTHQVTIITIFASWNLVNHFFIRCYQEFLDKDFISFYDQMTPLLLDCHNYCHDVPFWASAVIYFMIFVNKVNADIRSVRLKEKYTIYYQQAQCSTFYKGRTYFHAKRRLVHKHVCGMWIEITFFISYCLIYVGAPNRYFVLVSGFLSYCLPSNWTNAYLQKKYLKFSETIKSWYVLQISLWII